MFVSRHTDYSRGYFRQNDNYSLYIKREQSAAYCAVNKDEGGRGQDRDGKSNHFDGPVVNRQFITLTNIILQGRNGASKYTLQPGMGISGGSKELYSLTNELRRVTSETETLIPHKRVFVGKLARQNISILLWKPKFHHRVHNSPSRAYKALDSCCRTHTRAPTRNSRIS